jgi:hypothetical protein
MDGSCSQPFASLGAMELCLDENVVVFDEKVVLLDEKAVLREAATMLLDAKAVLLDALALLLDDDDDSPRAAEQRRAEMFGRQGTLGGCRKTDVVVAAAEAVRRAVTVACRDETVGSNGEAFGC